MTMRTILPALSRRLRRFRNDRSGLAAVEFVVILPLMLLLTFAMIEVTDGIAVDRKTDITARALSDLIAATSRVGSTATEVMATDADIRDAFIASTAIMTPYSSAPMEATVSQIKVDSDGNAKVLWSQGWAEGAVTAGRATGSVTLPEKQQKLLTPNSYLIWSEVRYYYSPAVPYLMEAGFLRRHESFSRPRHGDCVTYGPVSCSS